MYVPLCVLCFCRCPVALRYRSTFLHVTLMMIENMCITVLLPPSHDVCRGIVCAKDFLGSPLCWVHLFCLHFLGGARRVRGPLSVVLREHALLFWAGQP